MKTIQLILATVAIAFLSSTQLSIAQTLPIEDFIPFEMPIPPMKASYASSNKAVKNIRLTQLSVKKMKL